MDVVVGKIAFRGAEGVAVAVDFKGADLGKAEELPLHPVIVAARIVSGGHARGRPIIAPIVILHNGVKIVAQIQKKYD